MSLPSMKPLYIVNVDPVPSDSPLTALRTRLAQESPMGDGLGEAFRDLLTANLEPFYMSPMTQQTQSQMQGSINLTFRYAQEFGSVLMFADGAVYVGAEPVMKHQEHRVDLRWKTDFFPGPRYTRQHGDTVVLGFYGKYDLYVGMQGHLPPTLVARYGNGPGDYLTHNPTLLGMAVLSDGPADIEALFNEAYNRAELLGI